MFALFHNQQGQFGALNPILIGVADTEERLNAEIVKLCEETKKHHSKMKEYEMSRNYYISTVKRSLRGFLDGNRKALIEQKNNDTMNWHGEDNEPYHAGLKKRLEDDLIQQITDHAWHYFLPGEDRWKRFIDVKALRAKETVIVLPPYPKEPVLGVVYSKEHFFIHEVKHLT